MRWRLPVFSMGEINFSMEITLFLWRLLVFSMGEVVSFSFFSLWFFAYSFSPKARSPASPSPGTMYECSLRIGSMAAV